MSMSRHCSITKCSDGRWYLLLGNFEYAYEQHDCTHYGPFASRQALEKELDRHSNPGGMSIDESGTQPPPDPKGLTRPAPDRYMGRHW